MKISGTSILGIGLLVCFVAVVGPLVTIWSLNTLFPVLNIPFTLETWAAAMCLSGLVIRSHS